jgi:beta-phosphoglucomutase-like phosphatase (HAD superfamily)
VSAAWQAFVQVRLRYYDGLLADPQVLRANQWPHNVALLDEARRMGCKTALATMSRCKQARRVVEALDLVDAFDFMATHDDVERGKPDPEIYQLIARELDVPPAACLVIEDSPAGVKAALAAGTWCIVVTTPFTRQAIHAERLLDERWIVDDPDTLMAVVRQMVAEQERGSAGATDERA